MHALATLPPYSDLLPDGQQARRMRVPRERGALLAALAPLDLAAVDIHADVRGDYVILTISPSGAPRLVILWDRIHPARTKKRKRCYEHTP
jgi:hypothetical protein